MVKGKAMRSMLARVVLLWVLAIPICAPSFANTPAQVTSLRQLAALSNDEAGKSIPVKVEAIVTFVRSAQSNLFIWQNGVGLYVRYNQEQGLLPGDRVEITGVTAPSFRPVITAQTVRFLAHGPMPTPAAVKYEDMIQSKLDSQYVQISGHVLSASLDDSIPRRLHLLLKVPEGTVDGTVISPGELRTEDLLESDVKITGVVAGVFDGKMQMSGVQLDMNSWKDVEVLKRAVVDPLSALPVIPIDQVVASYRDSNQSHRVRIRGILTYYEPGSVAVVQQQGRSVMVKTNSTLLLRSGDGVEVTGFPFLSGESIALENAQLRQVAQPPLGAPELAHWETASVGGYTYDLVAMEGEVVGVVHDSRVDLFLLSDQGHLFSATLRHRSADANEPSPGGASPVIGSHVRVTGVCFVDAGNHWRDRLWFDLRMRSPADIVVVQPPTLWTVKHLAYIATALSGVILIAVIWVGLLDRRLRRQTAILARQSQEEAIRERTLARQEQQRSRILELISSAEPLPEVLREIQGLVSARLYGSACWFELKPKGEAGVHPPSGPGIVFQELFSPEGDSLGFLMATPFLKTSVDDDVAAALMTGARLAELAIDTRRLYSDLRHRSEYDLLTDIPNRFSMERQLDLLMLKASRREAYFGLVYVDLDRFKEVNDRYGHRAGDLYLQEVTRRMKLQLRSGDILARIGGDEFIALVPILRSVADAEEIATRIERSFDEPFQIEGNEHFGSASVGVAVYPEDGITKEELQRSADAAMYANKQSKRHRQCLPTALDAAQLQELPTTAQR